MSPTPQTPPTDRPLTAGDDLYERAKVFATRDKASTSYLQRRLQIGYNQAAGLIERIQAEGLISAPNHAGMRTILVPYIERPATSAASDAWQATIDRIVPVIAPMDAIEASEFCCEHTLLLDRTRIRRELAALASPPVSEREGELEAFLKAYDFLRSAWSFRQANALHGDNEKYRWACERFDAALDEADQARALTAQPAGEGK